MVSFTYKGLNFVNANRSGLQGLIATDTRVTTNYSTCTPGICLSRIATQIHQCTPLTISKTWPRRFIAKGTCHVTFTTKFHVHDITFIRKFYICSSSPRSKQTARKRRVSRTEQVQIVCNHDIFTLSQRFSREVIIYGTAQVQLVFSHIANVLTASDIDFNPFKERSIGGVVHYFRTTHLRFGFIGNRRRRCNVISIIAFTAGRARDTTGQICDITRRIRIGVRPFRRRRKRRIARIRL